ncbi:MAG: DUF4177 domain-containing protein [Bacteroidota bacterium]
MKKYEYKVITINAYKLDKTKFQAELQSKFEKWGEEGWDLVKMEPVNGGMLFVRFSTTKFLVVFKRCKE